MNWKWHLTIGLFAAIITTIILKIFLPFQINIYTLGVLALVSVVSPLIMDLDHGNGKLKDALTGLGLMLTIFALVAIQTNLILSPNKAFQLIVAGTFIVSLAHITPKLFKHRGFIHSITFALIYGLVISVLTKNIYIGIVALMACYSHLVLDKIPLKIT